MLKFYKWNRFIKNCVLPFPLNRNEKNEIGWDLVSFLDSTVFENSLSALFSTNIFIFFFTFTIFIYRDKAHFFFFWFFSLYEQSTYFRRSSAYGNFSRTRKIWILIPFMLIKFLFPAVIINGFFFNICRQTNGNKSIIVQNLRSSSYGLLDIFIIKSHNSFLLHHAINDNNAVLYFPPHG